MGTLIHCWKTLEINWARSCKIKHPHTKWSRNSVSNLIHDPPVDKNISNSDIKNKNLEAIIIPIFRRMTIISSKNEWTKATDTILYEMWKELWVEKGSHDDNMYYNTTLENSEIK